MNDAQWVQVTIAYPGHTAPERERHAVPHLRNILPAAERAGLITSWWFIRKGSWRIRYLPTDDVDHSRLHRLLTADHTWNSDIYEPEVHAFGGHDAMAIAHSLFHHDSHHSLAYLEQEPLHRRERSLTLCGALMRAAGLDLNEQADVWQRVADKRPAIDTSPPAVPPEVWAGFTDNVRYLMTGQPYDSSAWDASFRNAGQELRRLRDEGKLTRGIRAVAAEHVVFHWNRIGLSTMSQAALARGAADAVFGSIDLVRERRSACNVPG